MAHGCLQVSAHHAGQTMARPGQGGAYAQQLRCCPCPFLRVPCPALARVFFYNAHNPILCHGQCWMLAGCRPSRLAACLPRRFPPPPSDPIPNLPAPRLPSPRSRVPCAIAPTHPQPRLSHAAAQADAVHHGQVRRDHAVQSGFAAGQRGWSPLKAILILINDASGLELYAGRTQSVCKLRPLPSSSFQHPSLSGCPGCAAPAPRRCLSLVPCMPWHTHRHPLSLHMRAHARVCACTTPIATPPTSHTALETLFCARTGTLTKSSTRATSSLAAPTLGRDSDGSEDHVQAGLQGASRL